MHYPDFSDTSSLASAAGIAKSKGESVLKLGRSIRRKYTNKNHYHKGTHTEQRQSMAKQKRRRMPNHLSVVPYKEDFAFATNSGIVGTTSAAV
ncbi:MAG: hypothetical protein PHN71_08480 [Candidatus Cloacimonetes bacterium]|nr:hypothetical protein [Candidatus Cloacimonadota bacterium]